MNGLLNDVMQVAGAGSSRKGQSTVKHPAVWGRKEGEFPHQLQPPLQTSPQGTSLGLADGAFMCGRSRSSRSPWRCS